MFLCQKITKEIDHVNISSCLAQLKCTVKIQIFTCSLKTDKLS